jgi:hypothetical protein
MLRHAKLQTAFDLYAQSDMDLMREAQGAFPNEMGMGSGVIQ